MIYPVFIVFEGIEGSGKSTQIKLAEDYLKSEGIAVHTTFEPTKESSEIKERLRSETSIANKAEWFLKAFTEDRRKHFEREIRPKLDRGINVLCDRYDLSTYFYQHIQGISMDRIRKEHDAIPVPHKYFVYDCLAEVALARVKLRKGKRELFDRKDTLEELRDAYLKSPRTFPHRDITIINGSNPQEKVFRETILCLDSIFGFDLHRN